ncbi:acyltransferase [Spirosoma sp. KCTC 42546]|uniref:acyltransferase n=1 Tax=Spirosoma sp. KCTC 42546 TaxID=2520506 RepID=UPI00115C1F6E|nr:acyltransferase [Spirosoma sp. KCTC 42546]QDK78673.1 acyltransferase [Spirosoma sp. KCTC 42546]
MASFSYLWRHRAKFPITSTNFYRAWAKRLLSIDDLLIRNCRRFLFEQKGAFIDERAELGNVLIEGPKNLLSIDQSSLLGRVYIALHDQVQIGKYVCINDGVEILTASHDISDPKWRHLKGKITIDDYAWIGTGAMILPGVHIGRGAVVGARSVVSKSIEPYSIVVGNPARPTKKNRCTEFDYNPCEFLAANRAWLVG